jgi:uncharacterized protein (DUF58 family)
LKKPWPPFPSRSNSNGRGEILISSGYPVVFHWVGFIIVSGLLLLSAVQRLIPLLVIAVFFLVLGISSWLWSRLSMQGISFQLDLEEDRAFPGERIVLNFGMAHAKWIPLPWLEVEQELPDRLVHGRRKVPSRYIRERICWITFLAGRQQIQWKYRVECKARGDYRLGPVRLRSGDIFGLFPREKVIPCFKPLLIYPRIVPVDQLSLPMRELIGQRIAPVNVQEDTSLTMGSREYRWGDSWKHIHWKASARTGQLQARQYEFSTSLSLLLILDVPSFCSPESSLEEDFELAVTTVASLAYQAYREKSAVGFIANSVPGIKIPVHSGRSQLLLILEALARAEAKSALPLKEYLERNKDALAMGKTLVVVTRGLDLSTLSLVRKMKREGFSVVPVAIGGPLAGQIPGDLSVLSVRSIHDLSRTGIGGWT